MVSSHPTLVHIVDVQIPQPLEHRKSFACSFYSLGWTLQLGQTSRLLRALQSHSFWKSYMADIRVTVTPQVSSLARKESTAIRLVDRSSVF